MANKVRTITPKNNKAPRLKNAKVEVKEEEILEMISFFGLLGMKKDFLVQYAEEKYTRKQLDYALSTRSFNVSMLKDVRKFINDNKDEVSEFLNQPA